VCAGVALAGVVGPAGSVEAATAGIVCVAGAGLGELGGGGLDSTPRCGSAAQPASTHASASTKRAFTGAL
jgi:hypothetical protein